MTTAAPSTASSADQTTTPTAVPDLLERLRGYIGQPARAAVAARDPVNLPMIHHWCQALGDRNPAYADAARAAASRHRGLVAPPAMLQAWCMDKPADAGPDVVAEVMRLLGDAGFTSVVATNYEQEYRRELRLGDELSEDRVIEDVSVLKKTALGEGHFVTTLATYRDAGGDVVGTSRMRVLRFRPVPKPPGARPTPPINRDTAFFWDGVARGELLIQRCQGCKLLRHPPAPMCSHCGSLAWDTVQSSGRGVVHSYVVHHHPPLPGFDLPVTVVLVDLDEGVRMVADLAPGTEPQIGLPVQVSFVDNGADTMLPRFGPVVG